MSRSYKKTPCWGDKKNGYAKKSANRKVRRMLKDPEEDLSHKSYKRAFCSYWICDYHSIYKDFEDFYRSQISFWYKRNKWFEKNEPFPTREECWKDYQRYCLSK